MPKKVDPDARRRQLADALWRITRRDGWDAVSLRQVAAEAGVSMGMVQHYFASKDQMLQFALEMIGDGVAERIAERVLALPEPRDPREVVRVVLLAILPEEGTDWVEVQAMTAFLGRTALRPQIAAGLAARGMQLRAVIADQIRRGWSGRDGTVGPDERAAPGDPGDSDDEAERDAATLLALNEGLLAHILQGIQTVPGAVRLVGRHIDRVFDSPPG